MKVAAYGVVLTVVVTAILAGAFGGEAILAAGLFGLVATVIQVIAVAMAKPAMHGDFRVLVQRHSIGIGLRLFGVVLVAAAMAIDSSRFAPLPTAFGFLGVLVPLLFMEPRLLR